MLMILKVIIKVPSKIILLLHPVNKRGLLSLPSFWRHLPNTDQSIGFRTCDLICDLIVLPGNLNAKTLFV